MVERGFSVNKEIDTENMAGSTFAAKRMVCDHIHPVGGKQLLLYCASARQKYAVYLEDKEKNRSKVVAGQKRKALSDEVSELEVKRRQCRLTPRLCLLQLMTFQIKQRNCSHFW